jgi:hypothetical protein
VVGNLSEDDLAFAVLAWLVLNIDSVGAVAEVDAAAAAAVWEALELDPCGWIPSRVERLAAEYEERTYGDTKK